MANLHLKMRDAVRKITSTLFMLSLLFVISCGGSSSSNSDSSRDPALVGMWRLTSVNGVNFPWESGMEFRPNGTWATSGNSVWGGCDESGTWTTASNVATTIVTAVDPNGAGCAAIGEVVRMPYAVQGNILTFNNGADTLVYTKA